MSPAKTYFIRTMVHVQEFKRKIRAEVGGERNDLLIAAAGNAGKLRR
jgi:hypothetical protein